jgi:multiple sugar transport system permease protein
MGTPPRNTHAATTRATGFERPTVQARRRGWWASWTARVLLVLASLAFLSPFAWLFSTSVKPTSQLAVMPPIWIPHPTEWHYWRDAFTVFPYGQYFANTVIVTGLVIIGVLVSSAPVAYGFAKIPWPGRNAVFLIVLATMMVPYQVYMIPLYLVFSTLGWVGGFKPLTVPAFFGDAFSIFLLRQFFLGIPSELSEAARIDGASELRIFLRVVLPLAKPALATVALFAFVATWQDFLAPLIYLQDASTFTLSVALYTLLGEHSTQWQLLYAASFLVAVPPLLIFLCAQRTFIQGITLSGLKG